MTTTDAGGYSANMISEHEVKKLSAEVETLRQEVALLRSSLISVIGEDPEGDYHPSIVRELLGAASEKATYEFTGDGSLLSQLKSLKR